MRHFTVSVVSLIVIALAGAPAAAGTPAPWKTQVEQVCAKASPVLDAARAHKPESLGSGEDVVFSTMSPAEREDAAAFFGSMSVANAWFTRRLKTTTPDNNDYYGPYGHLISESTWVAEAYRISARNVRGLETGRSDDRAVAEELGWVMTHEQEVSRILTDAGISCDALQGRAPAAADSATTTTCFLGTDPAEGVEVLCTAPHGAELFINIDGVFPDSAPYPRGDKALVIASRRCRPEFKRFVGIPLKQSDAYTLWFILPNEKQWAEGNRSVDCYVTASDDGTRLTGSAAGTKR